MHEREPRRRNQNPLKKREPKKKEVDKQTMVNLVEAQKPLLHFLVKQAGLRQQSVEVEPGTVMSFWVPKDKTTKKRGPINNEIIPEGNSTSVDTLNENGMRTTKERPAVVLVHGFAAEGIVTWQFQVGVLAKKYDVYVPDLLFFGGSETKSKDRSPLFQVFVAIF
jgi:hypothetical protein